MNESFAAHAQASPLLAKSRFDSSAQTDEALARILADINTLLEASDKKVASSLAESLPPDAASFTRFYAEDQRRAQGLQAKLSSLIHNQIQSNWRQQNPNSANRLDSVATSESSAWIDAIPSSPDRRISDEDWSLAVKKRLGLPSYTGPIPASCCLCSADLAQDRDPTWHAESCKHLVPTYGNRRHNKVNRTLRMHAEGMNASVASEYRPPCSESKKRIDDDVLLPGMGAVLVDVSLRRADAASRSGSADAMFRTAENEKIGKYKDMAKDRAAEVLPFIVDEYGRFGPAAHAFIAKLVQCAAASESRDHSKQSATQAKRALMEDLAIAVQQQNAAMTRAVTNCWLRTMSQPTSNPALAAATANNDSAAVAMDLSPQ
jgi:hypothetical protein